MGNLPKNFIFLLLGCLLSGAPGAANGQSFEWWNTRHNWDGFTHWHKYIRLSPAFMGPNALPVPRSEQGILPEVAQLETNLVAHVAKGDQTQNMEMALYLPLFSRRVGLELYWVPAEYYQTDTLVRNLRRARGISGKGWATGDLYIGTHIQLIRNHPRLPDATLSIHLKTASGSKLSDARYTDTPGYYFNLAFGKTRDTPNDYLRFFANAGLYVWQTFGDRHYQNDAFLYGLGLEYGRASWKVSSSLSGYHGYIGDGDQPLVVRLRASTRRQKLLDYTCSWQLGLRDIPYASWRLGAVWKL